MAKRPRQRPRQGAGMDRQVAVRFDAVVYEHLQQVAADLGVSFSEYMRLMACWHMPYMLLVEDARRILQTGTDDPGETIPRLRSAIERMEAGQEAIDRLVERIRVGLPESQAQSREAAIEFKGMLQERLRQFEAAAAAFQKIRKRLGEPPARRKEGV